MSTQVAAVQRDEAPASVSPSVDLVAAVRDILTAEDTRLDYGHAKLALDRLIEPDTATTVIAATLDRLVENARRLAGPSPPPDVQLAALRRLIYNAGPWNDHRPFAYDHADPLGQRIGNKLLATYLATRRGNCVSMPALLLILAEKLGLDVALAKAPLHIFLRYRTESGRVLSLEATSGAHPARDEWYRQQMLMTDRAVASGLYLRTLPKREGMALLATTVLEHLIEQRRFTDATLPKTRERSCTGCRR